MLRLFERCLLADKSNTVDMTELKDPGNEHHNPIWFNYRVDAWDFTNDSYIEYTDEYGNLQSVPWTTTIEANLKPGTTASLHIDIKHLNGRRNKVYCAVRTFWDENADNVRPEGGYCDSN